MKQLKSQQFYIKVFSVMATILLAVLFASSVIYTGFNYDIRDEFVLLTVNNPFMSFVYLTIGICFLFAISFLYDKCIKKVPRTVILFIFMALGLFIAILYARTTATKAQADALCLAAVASEINNGTAGVYAYDSYIGVYSHQLGFVTVLRILFKLFGDMNYKAVQTVMAFLVPLIMLSGSGIINVIMKDNKELCRKSEFIYLVLSLINIPVYMYVIFVYGDIAYTALTLLGAWILLSALDKFNVLKAILFGLVCALEYLCKSNSLIVFVAFTIVLLISLLEKNKRKASLILLAFMLTLLIIVPKLNDRLYKPYMPATDAMPSIAWVGMGMNDDYGRAGWNNFYNQIAFAEAGYDADATKEIVKADIRATLGVWAHNPIYMLDFFNRKMNLQWNTPLYQGLVMNNCFDMAEQTSLGAFVYGSFKVQLFLQHFMKIFQLTMYAVVFLGLLYFGRKRESIADYALLIAIFGGFLFSLIWESKARYIFPYLVMFVPYFAVFSSLLIERFKTKGVKITDFSDTSLAKEKSYNGIDLFKFVMSIMVIVIHTVPYMCVKNEVAVRAIQGFIYCAVPFFFLSTGFLLGNRLWVLDKKSERIELFKNYMIKILKMYLIWNLVYLPLAISEYVKGGFGFVQSLGYYFRGFFFIGEHYNSWILWYLLSTIFTMLLLMLATRFEWKMRTLMYVGTFFFLLALFGEYVFEYGVYEPKYAVLIAVLTKTFYTCRVFKGLFYIPLGILMARVKRPAWLGYVLALLGYAVSVTGKFSDLPIAVCSLGIFMIASNLDLKESSIYKMLRQMSTVTYFTHMLVYTFVYMLAYGKKVYTVEEFVSTLIITLIVSYCWVRYGSARVKKFFFKKKSEV